MKKIILIFFIFSLGFSQTQQRASFQPIPTNTLKIGGYFGPVAGQPAGLYQWDSAYVRQLISTKLNGYIPNNGMSLDSIQFYNRIISTAGGSYIAKLDTLSYSMTRHRADSLYLKKLDTLTSVETQHRTDSIFAAFNTALYSTAHHWQDKQTFDSIKVNNISSGYIPYQNDFKFVNSLIAANATNIDVGGNLPRIIAAYYMSNLPNYVVLNASGQMVGNQFAGNGSYLTKCHFQVGQQIDSAHLGGFSGYLRAKLYRDGGTFGVNSVPIGDVLATSSNWISVGDNHQDTLYCWYTPAGPAFTIMPYVQFDFTSNYFLEIGLNYCMELEFVGTPTAYEYAIVKYDAGKPAGFGIKTAYSGGSWSYTSTAATNFTVFGTPTVLSELFTVNGNSYLNGIVVVQNGDTIKGRVGYVEFNQGIETEANSYMKVLTRFDSIQVYGKISVNPSSTFVRNGTTFIDASNNLSNIGTIGSGAITSTAAVKCASIEPTGLVSGYIPYKVAASPLTNSPFWTDGTSVGMGAASAAYKFTVSGAGTNPGINMWLVAPSLGSAGNISFGIGSAFSSGNCGFFAINGGADGTWGTGSGAKFLSIESYGASIPLRIWTSQLWVYGPAGFGVNTGIDSSVTALGANVRGLNVRGNLAVAGNLNVTGTTVLTTALDTAYSNSVSKITSGNDFLIVTANGGHAKKLTIDTTLYAGALMSGFLKYSDWYTFSKMKDSTWANLQLATKLNAVDSIRIAYLDKTNTFTQNQLIGGYLGIGITSAPSNTTSGDITGSRLFLGNASAITTNIVTPLQVVGTSAATSQILSARFSDDTNPPGYQTLKSRGSIGSPLAVLSGDILFSLTGYGRTSGGTNAASAYIFAGADNTPSSTAIPTAIYFDVANNTVPIEQMRINSYGDVGIQISSPTANLQVAQHTTGTGTVSTPGNSTTLTGVGTQFTNTFKIGDTITVAGETVRTIATITSDLVLDVSTAFSATPRSAVTYTAIGGAKFSVYGNGNVVMAGNFTNNYTLSGVGDGTGYPDGMQANVVLNATGSYINFLSHDIEITKNGSGNFTAIDGTYTRFVSNSTGTIDEINFYDAGTMTNPGGATIGAATSFVSMDHTLATNNTAFWTNQSAGTNNYSFQSVGSAKSFFNGNVSIGYSTPTTTKFGVQNGLFQNASEWYNINGLRIATLDSIGNFGSGSTAPLSRIVGVGSYLTNLNLFNFVNSDINIGRATIAQATDTSSINAQSSTTGKMKFSIINEIGGIQFQSDSSKTLIDTLKTAKGFSVGGALSLNNNAVYINNFGILLNTVDNAYFTGSYPVIYGTVNTGSSFPFQNNGNLVLQGRSGSTVGGIILATGATATANLVVGFNGLTTIGNGTLSTTAQARINNGLFLNATEWYNSRAQAIGIADSMMRLTLGYGTAASISLLRLNNSSLQANFLTGYNKDGTLRMKTDSAGVPYIDTIRSLSTGGIYFKSTNKTVTVKDTLRAITVSSDKFITDSAAYAGSYIADDHPDTLIFNGVLNQALTVGAVQSLLGSGYKLTSGGVSKNITQQDSSLTVGIGGNFEVAWSLGMTRGTGVLAGARFNVYMYVNDVKQEKTGAIGVLTSTVDYTNMSSTAMTLTLTKNDIIKLKMINLDDNTGCGIVILYARMHLKKHGINDI